MRTIRVKNWKKFQHYKDRSPPWIKLHRDLLRDYEFSCLQDASKLHLMLLWLLASQLDNIIPDDSDWLTRNLGLDKKINLKPLIDSGFIEYASNTLADCKQSAIGETETEAYKEETEGEKKKTVTRKTRLPADWQLTDKLKEYCKTKRPDLNPEETAESFADYWHGDGRTKADWNRVFQTWVRNQRKNNGTGKNQSGNGQRETPVQRSQRIEREELAKSGIHY